MPTFMPPSNANRPHFTRSASDRSFVAASAAGSVPRSRPNAGERNVSFPVQADREPVEDPARRSGGDWCREPSRAHHHPECSCETDTLDTPWKAEICLIVHAGDWGVARQRLDDFLSFQRATVLRVVSRAQRALPVDLEGTSTAMSYFEQALARMVGTRWRSKLGPGSSHVFDYSRNLPVILEHETRAFLRKGYRDGFLYRG